MAAVHPSYRSFCPDMVGQKSMDKPRWIVTLYLDSFLNLYHASNLIAGLNELAPRRVIQLSYKISHDGKMSFSGSSLIVRADITEVSSGLHKTTAFDLFDRSDRF